MPSVTILASAWSIQSARSNHRYRQINPVPIEASKAVMLLRTGLDRIPRGATVTSARLSIAQHRETTGGRTLQIRQVTSAWDSNVTWRTRPDVGTLVAEAAHSTGGKAGRRFVFNVTDTVQGILNSTLDNRGWQISNASSQPLTTRGAPAAAGPPRIVVEYAVVPDAPSNLNPSAGGISSSHPQLTFDADEDITALQIQVDPSIGNDPDLVDEDELGPDGNPITPSIGAAWDSGTFPASGGLLDLADPALTEAGNPYPGLEEGATTYWRARQRTAAGWSDWSDWAGVTRISSGRIVIITPAADPSETVRVVATNYEPNPSFETGTTGWTPMNGATVEHATEHAVADTHTMHVARGEGTTVSTANHRLDTLLPEAGTYTVTLRATAPATATGTNGFRLGGNGLTTDTAEVYLAQRDLPETTALTFTWDGQGTAWLYARGGNATSEMWVDAITITEGAPEPGEEVAYFDGDTQPTEADLENGFTYTWTGTPHASTSTRTATVDNPPASIGDDTPTYSWATEGFTQTAWRARLLDENGDVLADSDYTVGADTIWVPDDGFTEHGQTGWVEINAWDDKDRVATPGDPEYFTATQRVIFEFDPTVPPVDTLQVSQNGYTPEVILAGTRADIPDRLAVYRTTGTNAYRWVAGYNAADVFVPGSNPPRFTITDPTAPMGRTQLKYYVAARVGDRFSDNNPKRTLQSDCSGVWLTDLDTGDRIVIYNAEVEQTQPENAIVHEPINPATQGNVVRRRLVRFNPQGSIAGLLADVEKPFMPTARQCERLLRTWANKDAGHRYQLQLGGYTANVILADITFIERDDNRTEDRMLDVSLNWYAQR